MLATMSLRFGLGRADWHVSVVASLVRSAPRKREGITRSAAGLGLPLILARPAL